MFLRHIFCLNCQEIPSANDFAFQNNQMHTYCLFKRKRQSRCTKALSK